MKRRELTHAERVVIVERHVAGETLSVIAASLDANLFTVRHWWRAYRHAGWSGLNPAPKGPPSVGALGHFDPLVKYVALRLKREHPGWGLPMLRLHMQRRPSLQGLVLPKNTTLWSYLHQFGPRLLARRRPLTQRPAAQPVRAVRPHQCWQMDFKGDEMVHGCQILIYPFGLTDEASGAPLLRVIHEIKARGNHCGLTMRHVQADLRQAFETWGRPDAIRMDRDSLFIGSSHFDWPGTVLLWLVGLGIQPVVNRAYRPTDNAMIERAHRTWRSDVLNGAVFCEVSTLQAASQQALEDRRRYLPSRHPGCNGQPPAEAFPELLSAHHPYSVDQERQLFDLGRVDAYLAQWEWRRQVDSAGKISLAGRNHHIGKPFKGQVIKVRFDPATRKFLGALADGQIVAHLTLIEVTLDYILDQGV
jgi:transposase InsO family protein